MSRCEVHTARLAECHYQVVAAIGYSRVIYYVNGDHNNARMVAEYIAKGLDDLLSNVPVNGNA